MENRKILNEEELEQVNGGFREALKLTDAEQLALKDGFEQAINTADTPLKTNRK